MRKFVDENRPQLGWLVAFLLVVGIGLTAASVDPNADPGTVQLLALSDGEQDQIRSHAQAILDIVGPVTTTTLATTTSQATTSTSRPTTTTTIRPTTTTTIRPTTTTTIRPTTTTASTTTTAPSTTTTTGPLPTPTGPRFDFFVNVSGVGRAWTAPYFYNLPYTDDTGWADGQRDGYKCEYAILLYNDDPVGRVTFTRIAEASAYTIINDQGMPEHGNTNRHYNTGLATPQPAQQGECPPPTEAYEPSNLAGQTPVIDFLGPDGQLLERRDYRNVEIEDPRLKFRLDSADELRVTVIAYWENNPFVVVYYDAPWENGVTVKGYIP